MENCYEYYSIIQCIKSNDAFCQLGWGSISSNLSLRLLKLKYDDFTIETKANYGKVLTNINRNWESQ